MRQYEKDNVEEFCAQIRQGYYRTEITSENMVNAIMWHFDWWYHMRLLWIVFRGWCTVVTGRWNEVTWLRLALRTLRVAEQTGGKISAEGMSVFQNLDSPVVIVANHMSMLETFVTPCFIMPFRSVTVVLKKDLLDVPFFGRILRRAGCVSVTRTSPKDDLKTVLEEGEKFLHSGRSMLIFPQATRSVVFDRSRFNTIGVKLAKKAGVKIIPLALKTDFHGNGRFIKDFGPVRRDEPIKFRFGPLINVSGNGKEAHAAVLDFITTTLKEWNMPVKENNNPTLGDGKEESNE